MRYNPSEVLRSIQNVLIWHVLWWGNKKRLVQRINFHFSSFRTDDDPRKLSFLLRFKSLQTTANFSCF